MITTLLHAVLVSAATTSLPPQDGWLAFTGCWRAENAPPASLLCFLPVENGVRMLEIDNGATRERRIIADHQKRAISEEGCSGYESAHWSADGERLFLNTELTCGERAKRKTSGIFAFTLPNQWVSIQAISVAGQGAANTTRYFAVDAAALPANVSAILPKNRLARETARYSAAGQLDFDDVREALKTVEPRAVEALLVARQQPFTLNGKTLLALADEGMPDYVIDAMVAVSHPDVFEVATGPSAEEEHDMRALRDADDLYVRDRTCDAFGYSRWSAYDPYGCRYGYGYYSYMRARALGYTGYSPWDYYNPPVIIIRDRGDSGEPVSSGGKATRNGYRRSGSGDSDQARPRESTPSTSRPSTSSTSSSGSNSSSGSSSSGSSSGRTAKPRNN